MAEHSAVNRRVVGSSPTCGAKNSNEKDEAADDGGLSRLCHFLCQRLIDQLYYCWSKKGVVQILSFQFDQTFLISGNIQPPIVIELSCDA